MKIFKHCSHNLFTHNMLKKNVLVTCYGSRIKISGTSGTHVGGFWDRINPYITYTYKKVSHLSHFLHPTPPCPTFPKLNVVNLAGGPSCPNVGQV